MSEKKHAESDAPAPKKGKKKLFILVGAAVLVLLLGGGGAFFMLSKKKAEEAAASSAASAKGASADDAEDDGDDDKKAKTKEKSKKKSKKHHKKGDAKEGEKPVFVEAEPFTVNLADPDEPHMAQLKLTLTVDNEKSAEDVKAMMPALRNSILLLLSAKSSPQMLSRDGKEEMAGEIVEACNKALEDSPAEDAVTGVLFQSLIVQ